LFPRRLLLVATAALTSSCAPRIDFGSDILWSARHETGDLTEWSGDNHGGSAEDPPTATVAITTDVRHTGTHAVKLTNGASGAFDTARLWRESTFPEEAYYSAWFYLPQAYQTTADWTILQFRAPESQDPSVISLLLDIDLRSLPGGDLILSVFDHRAAYLRSPTPDVEMPVPIAQWFQIEVFFRNVADDSGRFTVWLDGQLNYDIQRPTGLSSTVYFSPCSSTEDLSPVDSQIYVDDAAVSVVRLTPSGTLGDL
jgi:hypothetical protein